MGPEDENMNKPAVWSSLSISLLCVGIITSASGQQDNDTSDAAKVKAASELARTALAQELKIDVATMSVIATEPQTWPDSSLGCGKPGAQAAQVMTSGYEILLKTPRGSYRVHSTANHAVVCGAATQWRSHHGAITQFKSLDDKIDAARADLAKKLGAPLNEIRTMTFMQVEWPDNSMDCSVNGEQVVKQSTHGYRIALRYGGRTYTYHTDLDRVRACPAIETN